MTTNSTPNPPPATDKPAAPLQAASAGLAVEPPVTGPGPSWAYGSVPGAIPEGRYAPSWAPGSKAH